MAPAPVAVVPLRAPGAGKTRLTSDLDPAQRAMLAAAMLEDVIRAIRGAGLDEIVVAADGPRAAAVATALGVSVYLDAPQSNGLDAVLADVTRRVVGTDVLIVVGDLPCLSSDEVRALLDLDAQVAVAPTHAGGTGGLLRRPAGCIPTAYGPDSAARHLELGRASGVSVAALATAGFRHDVDTWADLVGLAEMDVGAATTAILPQLRTGARTPADGAAGHGVRAG